VIDVSLLDIKAFSLITITDAGTTRLVSAQLANVKGLRDCRAAPDSNVNDERHTHSSKQDLPIFLTEAGITTWVSRHLKNALLPIVRRTDPGSNSTDQRDRHS
jgi:hypothetical protein